MVYSAGEEKSPHFLFFSMINCLFVWEKLGEIVENFSKFLQDIQYFLQEIPVFLPEILRFCVKLFLHETKNMGIFLHLHCIYFMFGMMIDAGPKFYVV